MSRLWFNFPMTTIYQLTEIELAEGITLTDELFSTIEPALAAGTELIHEFFEDDTIDVTWKLEDGTYTWTEDDMVVQIQPRQVR